MLNSRFYSVANKVYLTTDYENFKDHATIDESAAYFKDLKEYEDEANFEVTSGEDALVKRDKAGSATDILTGIVLMGALVGGVIWWGKKSK